jgi:hypothetical protein
MRNITFYGWQVGMRKVAFSRLLIDEAGLDLKEAHESTIRILDEQPVTLQVSDALAKRLLMQSKILGVKCRLEPLPEA